MRHKIRRILSLALAGCLLLSCAACSGAQATSMHLKRAQGTVSVADGEGKDVTPRENLGLYSGYGVDTRSESYAWIDLDSVKLTKLDENSEIEIQKEGKKLEIEVKSGSLFFNVTQPLAEDETLNIRSSTMVVGIRGTCGWVEVHDPEHMTLYLLEGTVECSAGPVTTTVDAGKMAVMTVGTEAGNGIAVSSFSAADIPAFVLEEVQQDGGLLPSAEDSAGPDSSGGDAEDTGYSRFFRGPKILRCLTYSVKIDGTEPLVANEEFLYDEQGNYTGYNYYSIDQNKLNLRHTRMEKYTFDRQGRIQGVQSQLIRVPEEAGDWESLTTIEQGPDYVMLGREDIQGDFWYYYNDLNQCVRMEYRTIYNGRPLIDYTTYEYDAQGKIILSEYYIGNYLTFRYVYEYEGDVSIIAGLEKSAEVTPEAPEPPENTGNSLLAPYTGTYTMYPEYESYRSGYGGTTVTLNADGTVTGGAVDGRTPSGIRQESNGSIVITYSNTMWFTLYPANGPTPSAQWYDRGQVNLEFMDAGGGLAVLVYHADPASLG